MQTDLTMWQDLTDLTAAKKVNDTSSESSDEVPTGPPILSLRTQFIDTN